jgi:hypothetical protein
MNKKDLFARKIPNWRESLPFVGIFLYLTFTSTGDTQSIFKFLTFALKFDLQDPWHSAVLADATWANGDPGPFVYPFGMYLILIPFRALTYLLGFNSVNYSPIASIPLNLMLTLAIYLLSKYVIEIAQDILGRNLVKATRYLILFSPALIVSFYLGRQYDILPTLFTLLALRSALRDQTIRSGLFLGVAISLKTFPLLLLLPICIYMVSSATDKLRGLKRASVLILTSSIIPILGTLIFNSDDYQRAVLQNPSMGRLFWFSLKLGGDWSPVLIFPAAYTVLMLVMIINTNFSKSKLNIIGISGVVLLMPCVLASPMVMWWTWSMPFILIYALIHDNLELKSSKVRLTYGLIALGVFNILVSIYDHWSYLTQLATWRKYPWPLPIAPQDYLAKFIGIDYAELLRQIFFSIQWGIAVLLIIWIFIHMNNQHTSKRKT